MWFSTKTEGMIMSAGIAGNQRYLNTTFRALDQMVLRGPAGYHRVIIDRYDASGTVTSGTTKKYDMPLLDRFVQYTPFYTNGDLSAPSFTATLYIGHLYIDDRVQEIFISRVAYFLVQLVDIQLSNLDSDSSDVLLNTRNPTTCFRFAVIPKANVGHGDKWHVGSYITEHSYQEKISVAADWKSLVEGSTTAIDGGEVYAAGRGENYTYITKAMAIKTVKITSYSNTLTDGAMPFEFFRDYDSVRFGELCVGDSEDKGMYTFALNNYGWRFSGHINMSIARETHLTITSDTISASAPALLVIESNQVAFALIAGGTYQNRYN